MSGVPDKANAEAAGWTPHDSEILAENPWFRLRRDRVTPPGATDVAQYSYVEHPGAVFVVPVLEDGRIVLIRSFRYTLDRWCWEVPAGFLDAGRSPEEAAMAELREEIGGQCDALEPLGRFFLGNGFARAAAHVFLARNVRLAHAPSLEPGEQIDTPVALPTEEAAARLLADDQDGDSALAFLLATRMLGGKA